MLGVLYPHVMLKEFLERCFAGEAIEMEIAWPIVLEDLDEGEALLVLEEAYRSDRLNFPGEVPAFDDFAAIWAARKLYLMTQLYLNRSVNAEEAHLALVSEPLGRESEPAVIYSADLTLRYVPDIYRLANQLAHADPLLNSVRTLLADWPLSSVGIRELDELAGDRMFENEGLNRFYFERCLERKAYGRIERVAGLRELGKAALGEYPELNETLAVRLAERNSESAAS